MSLALHGHHLLLIATLAFAAAVLTPNWFTSKDDDNININVFQICDRSLFYRTCPWIFTFQSSNTSIPAIKLIYPILTASFAIACAGLSLIGLLLGSWYIQQKASDNGSRGLLITIFIITIFSFLLSCGVWIIMLTTNMQQSFGTTKIRLQEFGFSFWINIGSSGGYLIAVFIYLIAICRD